MKITIDTHNCSREELQELKDYLSNESWDFEEEKKPLKQKYILKGSFIAEIGVINGEVYIDEIIRDKELFEYNIIHRESFILDLYGWIHEGSKDKELMKQDLKMLEQVEDDYIFSSIYTNEYITSLDGEFNSTCEGLISLNNNL